MTTTDAPTHKDMVQFIELERIVPSKTNPRGQFNGAAFAELLDSVRAHGVLQPILVRPKSYKRKGEPGEYDGYEIVAGHRRYAAAQEAKSPNIPAMVRELTDEQALELQLIENLTRSDLHPLEEAEGYQQLMAVAKTDAARIAERIGRSAKYVYDRVKLLKLIPKAKELFLANTITAGHAILLARLKADDQKAALDPSKAGWSDVGLFREDLGNDLFGDREAKVKARKTDPYAGMTLCSVREFSSWINDNVRFDPKAPQEGELFPETAQAIARAEESQAKVVLITRDREAPKTGAGGEHVYAEGQWRPADGKQKYRNDRWQEVVGKKCEHAVLGVVVIGEGRGESFDVCVTKTCSTHWPKKKPQASKAKKASADRERRDRERYNREEAERQERRKRWEKAVPAFREAIAERIKKAPIRDLGDVVLEAVRQGTHSVNAKPLVGRGQTADDLIRHAAYLVLGARASQTWDVDGTMRLLKKLGVDVKKILDKAAPVQTSAAKAKPAKRGKKK